MKTNKRQPKIQQTTKHLPFFRNQESSLQTSSQPILMCGKPGYVFMFVVICCRRRLDGSTFPLLFDVHNEKISLHVGKLFKVVDYFISKIAK